MILSSSSCKFSWLISYSSVSTIIFSLPSFKISRIAEGIFSNSIGELQPPPPPPNVKTKLNFNSRRRRTLRHLNPPPLTGERNLKIISRRRRSIKRLTRLITVAGNGTPGDLQLKFPTDVVADRNGYLYIADNHHNRVIRVKGGEYQCIVGCSGKSGSTANALQKAYAIRFDSHGDLYVADQGNHRIQNFQLISRDCGKGGWVSWKSASHDQFRPFSRDSSFKGMKRD